MVKVMTLYIRNQNNENSKYVLMYIKHHIRTLYSLGIRFKIDVYDIKRIKKEQKKLKQKGVNYFPSAHIGNKMLVGVDNILKFLESVGIQYQQYYGGGQMNNNDLQTGQQYNDGFPTIKRVEDCTSMNEYADMLNNPDYYKQFMTTDGKDEEEINDNKMKADINSRAAKMEEHRKLRSSPKGMAQAMDNEIEQIQNDLSNGNKKGNGDDKRRKAKSNAQTYDKMLGGNTEMNSYDSKMANSSDQNGAQLVEDWVSSVMNMGGD